MKTKLRRHGYGSGESLNNKVLKVRVDQSMFNKLMRLQEANGFCMARILREFIRDSLEKESTKK
jgi:hypothetical protein